MKTPKMNAQNLGVAAAVVSAVIAAYAWQKSRAAEAAASDAQSSDSGGLSYFIPAGASLQGSSVDSGSDLSGMLQTLASSVAGSATSAGADNSTTLAAIAAQSQLASETLGASLLSSFTPSGTSGRSQFSITTPDGKTLSAASSVINTGQPTDYFVNEGSQKLLNQSLGQPITPSYATPVAAKSAEAAAQSYTPMISTSNAKLPAQASTQTPAQINDLTYTTTNQYGQRITTAIPTATMGGQQMVRASPNSTVYVSASGQSGQQAQKNWNLYYQQQQSRETQNKRLSGSYF